MIKFYIFVSCGKQGAASLGCECAMPSCARAKPGIVRDHAVSRRNSPCSSPASGGFFLEERWKTCPYFWPLSSNENLKKRNRALYSHTISYHRRICAHNRSNIRKLSLMSSDFQDPPPKKTAIVIGAGPAGLTAAYELCRRTNDWRIIILEESSEIGGLSRTVVCGECRIDIGGHRFFSKSKQVCLPQALPHPRSS